VDILRQLLDPSGFPQRAESHPFKTSLYFFYPHYALPQAIQFHLLNTFSFNTCATAVWSRQFVSSMLWSEDPRKPTGEVIGLEPRAMKEEHSPLQWVQTRTWRRQDWTTTSPKRGI